MTIDYFESRCRRLNDVIKKMVFMHIEPPAPSEDYYVDNNKTLHTITGDTVSGSTVIINSGRATESGGKITFN